MWKLVLLIAIIFFVSCNPSNFSERKGLTEGEVLIDSSVGSFDSLNSHFCEDFPIPVLDSILPYFQTSGASTNSETVKFYHPNDSGIFVFYTLFNKKKPLKSGDYNALIGIGTIITHTYRKPKYGWSETDKDQTFILLVLNGKPIKITESIKVGATLEELKSELGSEIYTVDSCFIFLGKNKVIGRFNIINNRVESLVYGRFNLPDSVFRTSSENRKRIIQEKLEGINEKKS